MSDESNENDMASAGYETWTKQELIDKVGELEVLVAAHRMSSEEFESRRVALLETVKERDAQILEASSKERKLLEEAGSLRYRLDNAQLAVRASTGVVQALASWAGHVEKAVQS